LPVGGLKVRGWWAVTQFVVIAQDAETITIRHLDDGHEFSFRVLGDLLGQRRSALPVRDPALKHAAKSHPDLYKALLFVEVELNRKKP